MCALDFTFLGGSMGSVVGEKVTRALELGARTRTPVIVCSSSGGARMQEGTLSLMQMAKTSAAVALLAEAGVPYFSLLADPTYGGVSASFATLGDLIICEPKVRVGFAGPQVIEQTIRQKLPEGFQTAEFLMEKGQIDLIVPRAELPNTFKKLLSYHDRRPAEAGAASPRPAEGRSNGAARSETRSAWESVQLARHPDRPNFREYIDLICDSFTELHGDRTFRDDLAVVGGLAMLGGRSVMIVGHQKGRGTRENIERNFGMPHPEGYRKALRLMQYAGRMGLPLVTLDRHARRLSRDPGRRAQSERGHRPEPARDVPPPDPGRLHDHRRGRQRRRPGAGGRGPRADAGERHLLRDQPRGLRDHPLQGCRERAARRRGLAPDRGRAAQAGRGRRAGGRARGGAQADPAATAASLKEAIVRNLDALVGKPVQQLVEARYARFRGFGRFTTGDGAGKGD